MPEHRQAEGRLGDEDVAADRLERQRRSRRPGACSRPRRRSACRHARRDLRRTEHMAGRMEGDRDAVELDRLAEHRLLRRAGKIRAIAQRHDVERLARRQHRAMAGAGVVGMAVRDQRPRHRPHRIDEEIARAGSRGLRVWGKAGRGRAWRSKIGICRARGRAVAWLLTTSDTSIGHAPSSGPSQSSGLPSPRREQRLAEAWRTSSPNGERVADPELVEGGGRVRGLEAPGR